MKSHQEYRDDLPLYAVGALTQRRIEAARTPPGGMPGVPRGTARASAKLRRTSPWPWNRSPASAAQSEIAGPSGRRAKRAFRVNRGRAPLCQTTAPPLTPVRVQEQVRKPRGWDAWFWVPAFATACLAFVSLALWREDRALFRELRQQEHLTSEMEANRPSSGARPRIDQHADRRRCAARYSRSDGSKAAARGQGGLFLATT